MSQKVFGAMLCGDKVELEKKQGSWGVQISKISSLHHFLKDLNT